MSSYSSATRRNGITSSPKNDSSAQNRASKTLASSQRRPLTSTLSTLLPTPLETFLLALYPATLLLGSLFSLLNPPARSAPYSTLSQSHLSDSAPSYFAQKRNLFNTLFVKIGWFWTTFAFAIFLSLHPYTGPPRTLMVTPRRIRALIRWAGVTGWWVLVTQWAFGPGLIDRGFRLTGGVCDYLEDGRARKVKGEVRHILTSAACKLAGGQWKGGQDISGHVFLLTLGSAFLALEILPVVLKYKGLREQRVVRDREGSIKKAELVSALAEVGESGDGEGEVTNGVGAAVVVVALSWWMLLMTAAYFHTWVEKVFIFSLPR